MKSKQEKLKEAILTGKVVDKQTMATFHLVEDLKEEVEERVSEVERKIEEKIPDIKSILDQVKGKDGKDAEVDYEYIISESSKLIPKPKDGISPIIDYKKIIDSVISSIPKPKDGVSPEIDYEYIIEAVRSEVKDGKDASVEETAKVVLESITIPEETGETIVDKINELPTDDPDKKIDYKHIKNIPVTTHYVGGGGASVQKVLELIAENDTTHDTLQGVTDRGATTTQTINVGGLEIGGVNIDQTYVPYTGANADVDLDTYDLKAHAGDFFCCQETLANLTGTVGLTIMDGEDAPGTPWISDGSLWKVRVYGYSDETETYTTNYLESPEYEDGNNSNDLYLIVTYTKPYSKLKIAVYRNGVLDRWYLSTNATSSNLGYDETNVVATDASVTPVYYYSTNEYSVLATGVKTKSLAAVDDDDLILLKNNFDRLITRGGIYSSSFVNGFDIPSGAGNRLLWLPSQNAFRAGSVDGTQWDEANIGLDSSSFGRNNTSSGFGSFTAGVGNTASGDYGVAIGNLNTSSVTSTVSIGENNTSSGYGAISIGVGNNSTAQNSLAIGVGNTASSTFSTAIGVGNTSTNAGSLALNYITNASGFAATSLGYRTQANSYAQVTLGRFSANLAGANSETWVDTDPLVTFGNGYQISINNYFRSNSRIIYKNGNDQAMDNVKALFGTGSDASILYDGTNLIINPKEVGSGILDIAGRLQTDGYNAVDGTSALAGTKVYYVSDTSGGAVNRKLTFKDGLLVSET